MNSTPTTGPPAPQADRAFEQQLREMNEALLVSSVRQHELAEQAQKTERALAKALAYGDDIIATLREPFLVLDHDLRVKTANRSFYDSFHVSKEETENRLVYDLGNGQWDIPALRKLLDEVLSRNQSVHDFEVEHSFPTLGRKTMLLNARPFPPDSKHPELILLAVYDVSAVRERADELADLDRRKDEFLAMLSAMNFATPSPPSSTPLFSCACTATGIVCTASRTRYSSNPPPSLSVRWDNWHGSLMNCSKSLALPQAGFSFTKNGSPWASSWKMRWRRSAR